jgi:hypothetical protein
MGTAQKQPNLWRPVAMPMIVTVITESRYLLPATMLCLPNWSLHIGPRNFMLKPAYPFRQPGEPTGNEFHSSLFVVFPVLSGILFIRLLFFPLAFILCITLRLMPWRSRRNIPPNDRLTFHRLLGIVPQSKLLHGNKLHRSKAMALWIMPSSGMWCREALIRTDPSEESITSNIGIKRVSEIKER